MRSNQVSKWKKDRAQFIIVRLKRPGGDLGSYIYETLKLTAQQKSGQMLVHG